MGDGMWRGSFQVLRHGKNSEVRKGEDTLRFLGSTICDSSRRERGLESKQRPGTRTEKNLKTDRPFKKYQKSRRGPYSQGTKGRSNPTL